MIQRPASTRETPKASVNKPSPAGSRARRRNDVRGRAASPQRVVVHRRQVVVPSGAWIISTAHAAGSASARAVACAIFTRSATASGRQRQARTDVCPVQTARSGRGRDDGRRAVAGENPLQRGVDLGSQLAECAPRAADHSPIGVLGVDKVRSVAQLAALGQLFDPALHRAQLLVTVARQRDAPLEQRK